MRSLAELRDDLTDEQSRTAVLAGLATIPFTVLLSWDSDPSTFSGTPIFVAGLLVGYLYYDRQTESRAGKLTGIVGGAPIVIWSVVDWLPFLRTEPPGFVVAGSLLALIVIAVGVGLFALIGIIGAIVGNGVAERLDADGRATAERDARWWRYVAAYALVAPALAAALVATWTGIGVAADGAAAVFGGALAALSLFVLAIVAFYALFEDATALRRAGAVRRPDLWLVLGVPPGTYAVVYLAATFRSSANPSGDAVYGFAAALWLTVVAYLALRRRRVSAP